MCQPTANTTTSRPPLAPLPGCDSSRGVNPVVSLHSTTGYKLASLRDEDDQGIELARVIAKNKVERWVLNADAPLRKNLQTSSSRFSLEVFPGLLNPRKGIFTEGVEIVEEVSEKINGASDFVAVEAALAVIVEHGVPSGTGPQPVGKIGVQNTIGGDHKVWVVRGEVHVGEIFQSRCFKP